MQYASQWSWIYSMIQLTEINWWPGNRWYTPRKSWWIHTRVVSLIEIFTIFAVAPWATWDLTYCTYVLTPTAYVIISSIPSWALVGAGCSNQMQVAQGQGLVKACALVQAAIGCCIMLLLVPKVVLTLCNLRWWWCLSCHQLAQRPHLHLLWASLATCTGGVFLAPTSAYTNAYTWLAMLPLSTATCTGGVFPLPTRHLLMCTHAHEHILQLALCGGGGCMWWWFYVVSCVCVCACVCARACVYVWWGVTCTFWGPESKKLMPSGMMHVSLNCFQFNV